MMRFETYRTLWDANYAKLFLGKLREAAEGMIQSQSQ